MIAAVGHLLLLGIALGLFVLTGHGGPERIRVKDRGEEHGEISPPAEDSAFATGIPLLRWFVGKAAPELRAVPKEFWVGFFALVLLLLALLEPAWRQPTGIQVVAWRGGFLRTEVPENAAQLEMGSWGGLPLLLASWGAGLRWSEELGEAELKQADVVLVVHPDRPWPVERLERLRRYVEDGGRLLFVGGYHFRDGDRVSSLRQILEPFGVDIPFQTAIYPGRFAEVALTTAFHPVVLSKGQIVGKVPGGQGSSLRLNWRSVPLVWCRWGWEDPGSDALLTGVFRWDRGERLGDLVQAAEVPFGKGRVILWANPEVITDHNLARTYPLIGRLIAYLSANRTPAGTGWRSWILAAGVAALIVSICTLPLGLLTELILAIWLGLLGGQQLNLAAQPDFFPDGRLHRPWNNVVAIDLGHLNHGSIQPWSPDGWGAFQLLLLRCGYVPAGVERFTFAGLQKAGILVSAAPQRRYGLTEQQAIRRFLNDGGIFIATVGADRSSACRGFLRQLGLDPGRFPVPISEQEPEPEPMGCIQTFYRPGEVDYDSAVLFYAAWPVGCAPEEHLIRGKDNLPVAALRPIGRGKFVLIGDSDFILNTNLEFTQEPIDVRQINQAFWRWFLSWLTPQPDWSPPPAPERTPEVKSPKEKWIRPEPSNFSVPFDVKMPGRHGAE
jgi:hypothetical protein